MKLTSLLQLVHKLQYAGLSNKELRKCDLCKVASLVSYQQGDAVKSTRVYLVRCHLIYTVMFVVPILSSILLGTSRSSPTPYFIGSTLTFCMVFVMFIATLVIYKRRRRTSKISTPAHTDEIPNQLTTEIWQNNQVCMHVHYRACYTAKNGRHCNKFVDILQQTCYQQADIRMRSHGLRQLVDDKSVASCEQTCASCCQNLLSTGLLQVVSTRCNKSANDKLQQA